MAPPMSERQITIGPESRRLRAALGDPASPPLGGAVLCHPHPDYGGDMNNAVVVAAARALVASGWATLRFDFGSGAGRNEAAAIGDTRTALAMLAGQLPAGTPLALVGYSFGAWIACRTVVAHADGVGQVVAIAPPLDLVERALLAPLTIPVRIVVGDRDTYCSVARVADVQAASGGLIGSEVVRGADHFFAGRETDVAARVLAGLG
jgi:uncharacterized protein